MKYLKYFGITLSLIFFMYHAMAQNDIVINEIMYNPSQETGDDEYFEYVEIVNAGDEAIDISDWYFSEGFEYIFPVGTLIGPGEYLVIAQNPDSVSEFYGITNVLGPFISGALSNFGEDIELSDAQDFVIDYVDYETGDPWPTEPDGYGPSLELINPLFDNTIPQNWGASIADYGTPGEVNSILVDEIIIVISPNGGETWEQGSVHEILWTSEYFTGNVTIDLITSGRERETLVENTENDGTWTWEIPMDQPVYDGYMIQISDVEDGFPVDQSDEPFSIIPFFVAPDLVITEIMYNPPENGPDSLEYIEIINIGDQTVDLDGYYFSEGINFTFPSVILDSGDFVVVCKDSLAMWNTFTYMAYQWNEGELDDDGELVMLRAPNDEVIDSVPYLDVSPWPEAPDGTGPSLSFCDPLLDNSKGEEWIAAYEFAAVNQQGDTIYGSPGTLCLDAVQGLVITEIMYHPPDDETDSLEFIEIYNNTMDTLNLGGCKFTSGVNFLFPNVKIMPGSFIVVAQNFDDFLNSYGYPAYIWPEGDLSNTGETIELRDGLNNVIDVVTYDDELPWDTLASGNGHSLTLCDPSGDNSVYWNWMAAMEYAGLTSLEDSIWASPYSGCEAFFKDLVITEIMYNPPETGSDSLEYIEIYNKGSENINLDGYHLSNAVNYTFPDIEIGPGKHIVVSLDSVKFYSAFHVEAFQWNAGDTLSNAGDSIVLYDAQEQIVDYVEYSPFSPWDTLSNGQGPSLVLCNPFRDNSLPSSWVASTDAIAFNDDDDVVYGNPGSGCGEVPPLANFSTINNVIPVGDSVDFLDLSYNEIDSWTWIFEGADPDTSYDENPQDIKYNQVGTFDVTLIVENGYGMDSLLRPDYIVVNDTGTIPVPDFIASDTIIPAGTAIDFTDLSVGNIDEWLWTFEGAVPDTSSEQNPAEIVYPQVGEYRVTLTVSNNIGDSTLVKEDYILVGLAPGCDFTASDTLISPGSTVQFTDLSSGNPDEWEWVFEGGDPSSSPAQNPQVTYNMTGDFSVGLIVYNQFGESSLIKEEYIHVTVGYDVMDENEYTIYPNPADHTLFIRTKDNHSIVNIYTMEGRALYSRELNQKLNKIDISSLSKGIYVFRIIHAVSGSVNQELLIIE